MEVDLQSLQPVAAGGGRSAKVVHIMETGTSSVRGTTDPTHAEARVGSPPALSTWATPPVATPASDVLTASTNLAVSTSVARKKPSVVSSGSSIRRRSAGQSLSGSAMDTSTSKRVASEDRTINDQQLFYHGSAASDDVAPPIEGLTLNWCSHYTAADNRTHLGCDSWVDAIDEAGPQYDDSAVAIPDTLALLFIRCMRDFYRTGVRFSRRDGLQKRGGVQDRQVDPLSASISSGGSMLRMKIQVVEDELRNMRALKRKGSTADLFDDAALLLPFSTSVCSPSSSVSTSPLRRSQSIQDSTPMRRRSVLDLIIGVPTSSPSADRGRLRSSSDQGNTSSGCVDAEDAYDGSADTIPERHLVDRFTGPSLAALLAVTHQLFSAPHTKLSSLKLLNLSGCNIGDDGAFVVLQAIRFGPMKAVQCLDLMYNQLTVRSAFYMAVFLLLRPPVSIVDPDANQSLRGAYEESNVPIDGKQKALQLIAAKRAAQRGMGGSATNRQGPPLFFPLFESWKQLVQEYFSKRHRFPMSTSLNSPSRMTNLKNVVHAAMGFGGMKSKSSINSSGRMTPSESINSLHQSGARSGPFSCAFAANANVAVVDEDAFVDDDGDAECSDGFSDDSDAEDLEAHMRELEALLAPPGRNGGATADDDQPRNARRATRMGTAASVEMQRHLRELQDKEMKNAATDIVSLRLGWNDLEDEGLAMLSEWLAVQTFLLELNVAYNDSSDEGFMALRDAVRSTTSLVSLNTEGNPRAQDTATAEALRGALLYNRRILQKQSGHV